MNKKEVMWLMDEIQSYYPNFDVTDQRVEAWSKVFIDTEYRSALTNLKNYVSTEEKNVPPSVARLKQKSGGTDYVSMTFDQHRGVMLWRPDGGDTYEIPLTYHKGGYWTDADGREYVFAQTDVEYWDKFYKVDEVDTTEINALIGYEVY